MAYKGMIKKSSFLFLSMGIFISTLAPQGSYAQEKNEEVTIIAPYKPTVTAAQKINRNPKLIFAEPKSLPEISYDIHSKRMETRLSPESPKPANIPRDPQKDLYRSHIRAGFGNYTTPYVELWVNSLQSDAFNAGAHISHISSFGDIPGQARSAYSNSLIEGYGSKYFNENTLSGKLFYSNRMVHRYGFKPDEYPQFVYEDKDIRQTFQQTGINVMLKSNKPGREAFNYSVSFDAGHLFDKYESSETALAAGATLRKKMDLFGNRRSQELGLSLSADYYLNKDSLSDHNGGVLSGMPFLDMDLKPYRIFAGLKFDYKADTASKLYFYPVIRAEARLLENVLSVYAGMEGGVKKVSYEQVTGENPYVNSILPLEYSRTFSFSGGVKGRIAELIDFGAELRYASISNMPLFVNDSSGQLNNTFGLLYDDAGVFTLAGELGIRSRNDFGLIVKAAYHAYSMDTEEKAWHKPALELALNTHYTLNKLTLTAGMQSMQGLFARTYRSGMPVAEQLNAWFDLSLGGEYRINTRFSAFIKLNNLLSQDYERWYHYPVQGFNALAGVGFSF